MSRLSLILAAGMAGNGAVGTEGPLTSTWSVTAEGWRLHARVALWATTCSLPVVLVHGYGISSTYLRPIGELLAESFHVYAPDLPGHGRSDKPAHVFDVAELADALVSWMDSVELGRASFVGNSMGCQIAAHAAVRHPTRVDRLVLVGPTPDPSARSIAKLLPRFLAAGRYERPSLILLLLLDYARARPHRMWRELRYMLEDRIENILPLVRKPALVVRGENDRIVSQSWADEVARMLQAPGVRVVPGWGHALNYSAPKELHQIIGPFLSEARERGLK